MNTSTNDTENSLGGAFADGLTLIRILLTPLIMAIIIIGWTQKTADGSLMNYFVSLDMALLASALFIIAALTDIFDDYFGGSERSAARKLGWLDDIADIVLISGTLLALLWVTFKWGTLGWILAVPAAVIIIREIIIGALRGRNFREHGWPETELGSFKNGILMLAICLLVASPWLTSWVDSLRSGGQSAMNTYDTSNPAVWWTGLILLWQAAILSLYTGFQLLRDVPEYDEHA
jgi:phosphatidylglycerophosphate synthase